MSHKKNATGHAGTLTDRHDALEAAQLPRSLGEALDELEGCKPLQELMGARFVRAYVSVKRKEYETFFRVISSWEREFLLLNV